MSDRPYRRITQRREPETFDAQDALEDFSIEIQSGPVDIFHANLSAVGMVEDPLGITIGRQAHRCSNPDCDGRGIAFILTPTVDLARSIAAQLIELADEIEGDALAAANAALAAARRPS